MSSRFGLCLAGVGLALLAVGSCTDLERAEPAPSTSDHDVGAFLTHVVSASDARTSGCGDTADGTNCVVAAVALTTELCLTCRDIGWMMREVHRTWPTARLVVVTDAGDAPFVRQYLAKEKVEAGVLVRSEESLAPWWPPPENRVIVAWIEAAVLGTDSLKPVAVLSAPSGAGVLDSLRMYVRAEVGAEGHPEW